MSETPTSAPSEPPKRRGLRKTAARAGAVALVTIKVLKAFRSATRRVVEVLLALIIIFEEWGWKPLAALLAQLARLKPFAAIEAIIVSLPPYAALAVFALPTLLLLPLKLVALWLIATGHVIVASLLFVGAKLVGTALIARIFQLTQPRLMQLRWFASIYNTVIPWKEALVAKVKASATWTWGQGVKAALKRRLHVLLVEIRSRLESIARRMRGLLGRR